MKVLEKKQMKNIQGSSNDFFDSNGEFDFFNQSVDLDQFIDAKIEVSICVKCVRVSGRNLRGRR